MKLRNPFANRSAGLILFCLLWWWTRSSVHNFWFVAWGLAAGLMIELSASYYRQKWPALQKIIEICLLAGAALLLALDSVVAGVFSFVVGMSLSIPAANLVLQWTELRQPKARTRK